MSQAQVKHHTWDLGRCRMPSPKLISHILWQLCQQLCMSPLIVCDALDELQLRIPAIQMHVACAAR